MLQQDMEGKPQRNSNLELYRVICMLTIVMHHYVVNSGLLDVAYQNPSSARSIFYYVFGMWGKIGINCFVMITGFFMCQSRITLQKFLKLLFEVLFYNVVIYSTFVIGGYEELSVKGVLSAIWPVGSVSSGFVSCFLIFYLTIPFLNVLVRNINKRQHLLLLALCLGIYSVLGTVPAFDVQFNYVTWFIVIFFIASYIRLYPEPWFENEKLWGVLSFASVSVAIASVFGCVWVADRFNFDPGFWSFFVADSNKLPAVVVAVCTFLWFKNLKIRQSRFINTVAASTFGVLCIHANSNTMRHWLWNDILDVQGQYTAPWNEVLLHAFGSVLGIYVICTCIDILRKRLLENGR